MMAEALAQLNSDWLQIISRHDGIVDTATRKEAEPGKGIYLGHAFSAFLQEGNTVIGPEFPQRQQLELIMSELRNTGYAVHCALEREEWGKYLMPPDVAIQLDAHQVTNSDWVVTYPQHSSGAFMEIGMAIAALRPLLIMWRGYELHGPTVSSDLYAAHGAVGTLQSLGVPSKIILDNSKGLEDFQERIFPELLQTLEG